MRTQQELEDLCDELMSKNSDLLTQKNLTSDNLKTMQIIHDYRTILMWVIHEHINTDKWLDIKLERG